jgi:hypothetical protein
MPMSIVWASNPSGSTPVRNGPVKGVGALGVEPPQTVAAIARDPIKDVVADGDELMALVDILPRSGLHRGLRQRRQVLRIEAPQPVFAGLGHAIEHVGAQRNELMPELDRIERPLRPVSGRQGIGLAIRGRLGVEVPELEGAAANGRNDVEHEAAERQQHQLLARIVGFVVAAGIAEIGAVLPELGLRPDPTLHRLARQRVLGGRIELEQPVWKAKVRRPGASAAPTRAGSGRSE